MNYTGQFDAQNLTNWESMWGGGSLPAGSHGKAVITPGMSIQMTPGGAWDTFYQLQRMPAQNAAQEVTYRVSYKVSDADLPTCQAVEGEVQRNDGQLILNGGFQCDFRKHKAFCTYDFNVGDWVPTGIPVSIAMLAGGKTLTVVMVYDLTPRSITFRGVQLNGQWNALGITRAGKAMAQLPYLNYATQYDFTSTAQPATLLTPSIDIVVT